MKGYNGVVVKDVYKRGDKTTRPKPDWVIMGIGDGAENSHFTHRRAGEIKTHPPVRK
jgi:hypothetical protein